MTESAKVTNAQLTEFARRLGPADYEARCNYFRLMEYPVALHLLDARPGMSVLDVGSGYISLPPLWLAAERGCRVTVVDVQPFTPELQAYVDQVLARLALRRGEQVSIVSADARSLPWPDHQFDRIAAISSLEHLELFSEPYVMRELGRLLKPGGRMVFSLVVSLDRHIEQENWGGEGYDQRHYSEVTLRERLIEPSGLFFAEAAVFGEADPAIGRHYLTLDRAAQIRFTEEAARRPDRYWREYYTFRGHGDFAVNAAFVPSWAFTMGGIIAVALEKRQFVSRRKPYDALASYLANERLTRHARNSDHWLTIDRVRIEDASGAERDRFAPGEPCRFRLAYTGHGPVIDPTFRILFHDQNKKIVAGLHTARAGVKLGEQTGPGELVVAFESLNLVDGTYDVTVGAWDRDRPDPIPPVAYDVHLYRYRIIITGGKPGPDGVAYLPFRIDR